MSYEQDMYIDENALDVELIEQPSLMQKYTQELAEAKLERDLAKEALDLKRAEIDLDVRDNPENYQLTKITEAAIGNCILMEDEYKELVKVYNEANFEVNVLQGVVSALDHRKSSLEKLVTLHGQNYFAGPVVPHDITELRREKEAERNRRISKNLTRKTK